MASFLSNYKLFSKIIIISIFIDFIIRRLLIITMLPENIAYIITANYIILMVVLVALVYYRIYEFLLLKIKLILKLPIVAGGVCFILLMVMLLYLREFNSFYYVLLFTFYAMLAMVYIPLLYILIDSATKSKNEYKISLSVFISLLLISFLLNTMLDLSSILPNTEKFSSIQHYFEKVSIYTILVIMLYFSLYNIYTSKKNDLVNKILKSIMVMTMLSVSIMISKYSFANVFTQIFGALSIKVILPDFIYIFVSMSCMFAIIKLFLKKSNQKTYFIALAMFILSGLSSTDLYLRLLSIFSLIEMINLTPESSTNDNDIHNTEIVSRKGTINSIYSALI